MQCFHLAAEDTFSALMYLASSDISPVFWGLICTGIIPLFSQQAQWRSLHMRTAAHPDLRFCENYWLRAYTQVSGELRREGSVIEALNPLSQQESFMPYCQFWYSLLGLALQLTSLRKEVTSYILVTPHS